MQETTGASESGSEVHAKLNAYNRFRLAFCAKARHNGNFREQRVNLGGGTEVIVSLSTRYDAANPVTWSTPLNMSVYTYWSGVPAPFVVSVDNVSGDLVIKGRGREHVVDPTKSKDLLRDLSEAVAFYGGAWQYVQGGGDHAFRGFDAQIPAILRFATAGEPVR